MARYARRQLWTPPSAGGGTPNSTAAVRGSALGTESGASGGVTFSTSNFDVAPVNGDLLVVFLSWSAQNQGSTDLSLPSGWVSKGSIGSSVSNMITVAYTHTYATGETSYAWTGSVDATPVGVAVAVKNQVAYDTINTHQATSGTSCVIPGVTTTYTNELMLVCASIDDNKTFTFPGGDTVLRTQTNGSTYAISVAKETVAAAGATGSRTISSSAAPTAAFNGILVTIK